ncbi:MAG: HisA/HisF-related TIM barrel protein [Chthoniobacter sp.]|nr:HisA/HisF-related TIM barrel protein [Chthoniobacter sp.]
MALRRIIGSIFVRERLAVQCIRFRQYLPIGDPAVIAEAFDHWQADEILLADITASGAGRLLDTDLLGRTTRSLRTPVTAGGGVRSVKDVESLLRNGADRIFINTAARRDAGFVNEASRTFGSQCIVVWVDVCRTPAGLAVYDHLAEETTSKPAADWMRELEDRGAGEIILHAVDGDGAMSGFDLELAALSSHVHIPVIISGGASRSEDFADVFRSSPVSGACAGNLFSHKECAISEVKAHLMGLRFDIRHLS